MRFAKVQDTELDTLPFRRFYQLEGGQNTAMNNSS
jgi:hypothetical protein